MTERLIVQKIFESKGLNEASFQSGGSTYSCTFGRYYKDGEKIDRDEYFKAKASAEEEGSSASAKSGDNHHDQFKDGISKLANASTKKYKDGHVTTFSAGPELDKFSASIPNSYRVIKTKGDETRGTAVLADDNGNTIWINSDGENSKIWVYNEPKHAIKKTEEPKKEDSKKSNPSTDKELKRILIDMPDVDPDIIPAEDKESMIRLQNKLDRYSAKGIALGSPAFNRDSQELHAIINKYRDTKKSETPAAATKKTEKPQEKDDTERVPAKKRNYSKVYDDLDFDENDRIVVNMRMRGVHGDMEESDSVKGAMNLLKKGINPLDYVKQNTNAVEEATKKMNLYYRGNYKFSSEEEKKETEELIAIKGFADSMENISKDPKYYFFKGNKSFYNTPTAKKMASKLVKSDVPADKPTSNPEKEETPKKPITKTSADSKLKHALNQHQKLKRTSVASKKEDAPKADKRVTTRVSNPMIVDDISRRYGIDKSDVTEVYAGDHGYAYFYKGDESKSLGFYNDRTGRLMSPEVEPELHRNQKGNKFDIADQHIQKYAKDDSTTATVSGKRVIFDLGDQDMNNKELIDALEKSGFERFNSFRFIGNL